MVANQVALRGDAPHKCGFSLGKATDHKERRLYPVFGEEIEQPRRPCRIWPIVKRQR
jgi:hypothetical protein